MVFKNTMSRGIGKKATAFYFFRCVLFTELYGRYDWHGLSSEYLHHHLIVSRVHKYFCVNSIEKSDVNLIMSILFGPVFLALEMWFCF